MNSIIVLWFYIVNMSQPATSSSVCSTTTKEFQFTTSKLGQSFLFIYLLFFSFFLFFFIFRCHLRTVTDIYGGRAGWGGQGWGGVAMCGWERVPTHHCFTFFYWFMDIFISIRIKWDSSLIALKTNFACCGIVPLGIKMWYITKTCLFKYIENFTTKKLKIFR